MLAITDIPAAKLRFQQSTRKPPKGWGLPDFAHAEALRYLRLIDDYDWFAGFGRAWAQGALAVSTAVDAANGKLTDFAHYMPNQSITKDNIGTYQLEGKTVDQLCAQ